MVQEIITYLIIFLATTYTIYGIVRLIFPKKTKSGHMCTGSCAGCSLKNKSTSIANFSGYKF